MVVPAATPYERQLLFDRVTHAAAQQGSVAMAYQRHDWTVRASDGSTSCEVCDHYLDHVVYVLGARMVCSKCAQAIAAGCLRPIVCGVQRSPRRRQRA